MTSQECPQTYPLKDILEVYWDSWEIELSYKEFKQYQLDNTAVLQSQKRMGSLKSDGGSSSPTTLCD
jgi:hypothetical protein